MEPHLAAKTQMETSSPDSLKKQRKNFGGDNSNQKEEIQSATERTPQIVPKSE